MALSSLVISEKLPAHGDELTEGNIIEERYSTVYSKWIEDGAKPIMGFSSVISSEGLTVTNSAAAITKENSKGYEKSVVHLKKEEAVEFTVTVEEEGLYEVAVDYYPLSEGLIEIQGQLMVNGAYPYYEARRIVFPVLWESATKNFEEDRKGNQVAPLQLKVEGWRAMKLEDPSNREPEPLKIFLNKGINTLRLIGGRGEVLIGDIAITSPEAYKPYSEYIKEYQEYSKKEVEPIILEAEKYTYKNKTSSGVYTSRDLEVSPYSTNKLLLNTFYSMQSGEEVYYEFEIEETGMYSLAFKVNQQDKANARVYRTITIDDKIPFQEAKSFPIDSTDNWETIIFGGEKPYEIYLEKGTHSLKLEADASPQNQLIKTLTESMNDINDLSLEIKKLVGNNDDPYRDWIITDYIPDIEATLLSMASEIEAGVQAAIERNNGNGDVEEFNKLKIVIDQLRKLSKEPDELPNRLSQLAEGSGSAAQTIGDSIALIEAQPLILDQLYIYSEDSELPDYRASIFTKAFEGLKRFFSSFVPDEEEEAPEDEIVIEVWVNRARSYVDLLQKITDDNFTRNTGIKVNYSIISDEQKLILSNSANTQPDVALGVTTTLPYEFAIRNSAQDLSEFDDFQEVVQDFSPGALMSYTIDGGVYGLPETQDFYVTFYRQDILNSLNIPVPDTWEEVVEILPELQRYGMNYYTPLSVAQAYKPFMFTAPFIYQHNGRIYNEETLEVDLTSEEALEGVRLMSDLFTIYGLPLQVTSFYNSFRYGTLPIGIGNLENYLKLKGAAPELEGSWRLAPHPGVREEDGTITRWATGSAQGTMMFKDSEAKDASWEFLKWWLSSETQVNYSYQLQNIYGQEYFWSTANIEAFKQLPLDEEDKEVILEQWQWLFEVPKVPGGYMVERELSNAWNEIVFEDENPRAAIDSSLTVMNREVRRKLEEFGYIEKGRLIKKYQLPSMDNLRNRGGQE